MQPTGVSKSLTRSDLGYHSLADMVHFLPGEHSVERDGRSTRRQIYGLPCARDRCSDVRPLFAPFHPVSSLPVPGRSGPEPLHLRWA